MPTCCQALAGSFPRPEWGVQGTRDHWDTLLLGKHSTGKHGGHALDCTPPPVPPRPCLSVRLTPETSCRLPCISSRGHSLLLTTPASVRAGVPRPQRHPGREAGQQAKASGSHVHGRGSGSVNLKGFPLPG